MNATITLPAWVVLLLVMFTGWALLVLLLTPSMRWFLRRRANVLIGELNTRLQVELPFVQADPSTGPDRPVVS